MAQEHAYEGGDEVYNESQHGRASKTRVDAETLSYLKEIEEHFGTLTDDEEKQLLASRVIEELQGKEVRVATDSVTSRILEKLLPCAGAEQLAQFVAPLCQRDPLFEMACSPFGCHVAEKVLGAMVSEPESMDEQTYGAVEGALGELGRLVSEDILDYISDRYATHLARRLLCIAAGRDVLPAKKQRDRAAAAGQELLGKPKPAKGKAHGLGTKLGQGVSDSDLQQPAAFPSLLQQLCEALMTACGEHGSLLATNMYSSPFMQAALRACAADWQMLGRLIPRLLGAPDMSSLDPAMADSLMKDHTGSHLIEAIVQVAPKPLYQQLYAACFKGRLAELALHPVANYVVQAALSSAQDKALVNEVVSELRPLLGELLRGRRSGVVAALAAACNRLQVGAAELCSTLAAALQQQGLPPPPGQQQQQQQQGPELAAGLLCLDTPVQLLEQQQQQQQQQGKLSAPGCAILIQLLKMPLRFCQPYVDSLLALPAAAAAAAARDAGGSRVFEALLDGGAPLQQKQQLLLLLASHWGSIALSAAGSFLAEKAYSWAAVGGKEEIVVQLLQRRRELEGSYWGPQLLRRCGADIYQRSASDWRKQAETAAKTLEAYADLFGEGGGKKGQKRKQQQQQQQQVQLPVQQQQKRPRQEEQQQEEVPAAAVPVPAAAAGGKKAKKQKKAAAAADANALAAISAALKAGSSAPPPAAAAAAAAEQKAAALGGKGADDIMGVLGFGSSKKAADAPAAAPAAAAAAAAVDGKKEKKSKKAAAVDGANGASGKAQKKKKEKSGAAAAAADLEELFSKADKGGKKRKGN